MENQLTINECRTEVATVSGTIEGILRVYKDKGHWPSNLEELLENQKVRTNNVFWALDGKEVK